MLTMLFLWLVYALDVDGLDDTFVHDDAIDDVSVVIAAAAAAAAANVVGSNFLESTDGISICG